MDQLVIAILEIPVDFEVLNVEIGIVAESLNVFALIKSLKI